MNTLSSATAMSCDIYEQPLWTTQIPCFNCDGLCCCKLCVCLN